MALTIQSILQQHAASYFARHRWPLHVHRAAQAMQDCRTAALGGHVERCPNGHVQRVFYNSCRHRSCPACNALPRERWLAGWKRRLLPTDHRHLVFTVPADLNVIWRYNRTVFARILFSAVHDTLLKLLGDKKYLGARPGILASLHTWGQQLQIHLHVHVLVTAGGWNDQGTWCRAKKKCLLPRQVLMEVYRGKLRSYLRRAAESGELVLPPDGSRARFFSLLNRLGRVAWNVKLMEPYAHGQGVATYLARYAWGGPLKNQRLLSFSGGRVAFRYRDNRERDPRTGRGRVKTMDLAVDAFLDRFFEHVPPAGLRTIRCWGLYASSKRDDLAAAHEALGSGPIAPEEKIRWQDLFPDAADSPRTRCPVCGAPFTVSEVLRPVRGPPTPFQEDAA